MSVGSTNVSGGATRFALLGDRYGLRANLPRDIHVDTLLMRPDDDKRSNPESKFAIYSEYMNELGIKVDHVIVIDDHDGVVGVFKNAGITVLQAYVRRI